MTEEVLNPFQFLRRIQKIFPWVKVLHRDGNLMGWCIRSCEVHQKDFSFWEPKNPTPGMNKIVIDYLLIDEGDVPWNSVAYHINGYKIQKNGDPLLPNKKIPRYALRKKRKVLGNVFISKRIKEKCSKCGIQLLFDGSVKWCSHKECSFGRKIQ